MTTQPLPKIGQVVTGTKLAGRSTRRLTVTVTQVHPDLGVVVGLLHYAGTRVHGDRYEGSHRGITTLDLASIRPA